MNEDMGQAFFFIRTVTVTSVIECTGCIFFLNREFAALVVF